MAVPAAVDDVIYAERAVRAALVPVDARVIAVELDRTVVLFGTPDRWDAIAGSYFEALEDVPEDLLLKACRHVRLTCKFFPRPSEFREPIRDEMAARKMALAKLEMMASRAVALPAPPARHQDPQRRAEIADKAVGEVRRLTHAALRLPAAPLDDQPVREVSESLRRAAADLAGFRLADISEAEAEQMLSAWGRGGK